jgi:plastocyanin
MSGAVSYKLPVRGIFLLALVAACFSEREATGPLEGVCSLPVGEGVPGSTLVIVRAFTFTPAELRVRTGDRVTWVNCDPDPHTSTADGGQWSSPLLSTGDAFTHTFDAVGDYPYHCEPHPFMTARVIVE